MGKQWGRERRPFAEEPMPAPARFRIGDRVHAVDDGTVGHIEYVRASDGMCCLQWPSGTREWLHESALCGPLAM
jgi:hypothetical protein